MIPRGMLQTMPRVPVAGVKRRWGGTRTIEGLQESSPEVSSSGVLSPPPHFHPATPDSNVTIKSEELHIWDLDLQRGGLPQHVQCDQNTTSSVYSMSDAVSPCTTIDEGTTNLSDIIFLVLGGINNIDYLFLILFLIFFVCVFKLT